MNPKLDAVALVPMFPHSLTSGPWWCTGSEIRIDTLERNKNNPGDLRRAGIADPKAG